MQHTADVAYAKIGRNNRELQSDELSGFYYPLEITKGICSNDPMERPSSFTELNFTLFETLDECCDFWYSWQPGGNCLKNEPVNKVNEITKEKWDGSSSHVHYPLGLCEGECDKDRDCEGDLICYQRGSGHAVPGCSGVPGSRSDFCIDPQALIDAIPFDFTNIDTTTQYEGMSKPSRLRLFWHEIYYWQETRDETFWCMQCEGPCEEGQKIKINHCDETDRQYFIADGETIRPKSDTTLCMTETGFDKEVLPVQLMPCDDATNQQFWGYKEQGPFQLRPRTSTSTKLTHCLTQHHHPKAHEAVYPRTCTIVEDNDTSLWTRYIGSV